MENWKGEKLGNGAKDERKEDFFTNIVQELVLQKKRNQSILRRLYIKTSLASHPNFSNLLSHTQVGKISMVKAASLNFLQNDGW